MQQHTYKHIEALSDKSRNKYKQHTQTNPHRLTYKNAVAHIYLETTKEELIVQRCKKRFDYQGKSVFKLCRRDPKKSKQRAEMCVLAWDFFLNQLPFGDMVKGSDKWMSKRRNNEE